MADDDGVDDRITLAERIFGKMAVIPENAPAEATANGVMEPEPTTAAA
jgi:hypothetical protein